MKTIYLIKHEEYDNDLRRWEVDEGIAFLSEEEAKKHIKGTDKIIDEIELIEDAKQ